MAEKLIILGLVATMAVTIAMLPIDAVSISIKNEILPHGMDLVVSVDGKSFFAEYLPFRSWNDAARHCESLDLKLASVTSMAQFDALNSSFSRYFDGSFWTSGRDALALRQFSWNASDEQPLDAYRYRNNNPVIRTCLTYYSTEYDSYFFPLSCETPAGTLCET